MDAGPAAQIGVAHTDPPVRYCAPGLHQWGPRWADDHPLQCWHCPVVERQAPAQGTLLQTPRAYAGTTRRDVRS